jgi:hypothetical protein
MTTASDIEEIVYHVAPSDKPRKWHCARCGLEIFYSHHRLVKVAEEGALSFLKPPIIVPCMRCRTRVAIQDII